MSAADYSRAYFDLANGITGFAVIQMITYLVALGTSREFLNAVRPARAWRMVVVGMLIATALYIGAVVACAAAEMAFRSSGAGGIAGLDIGDLIMWTAAGRIFAITAISAFGLFVHWHIGRPVAD